MCLPSTPSPGDPRLWAGGRAVVSLGQVGRAWRVEGTGHPGWPPGLPPQGLQQAAGTSSASSLFTLYLFCLQKPRALHVRWPPLPPHALGLPWLRDHRCDASGEWEILAAEGVGQGAVEHPRDCPKGTAVRQKDQVGDGGARSGLAQDTQRNAQ